MLDTHEKLETVILVLLVIFILSLPYSIYIAQSSVHLAMILWLIKIFNLPLKEKIWISTKIDTPFFFFMAVVAAAFVSRLGHGAMLGDLRAIRSYRHILILFLVVNNIRRKEMLKALVFLACLGGAANAAQSCWRYACLLLEGKAEAFGSFTESVLYWHVAIFSLLLFQSTRRAVTKGLYAGTAAVTIAALFANQKYEVWVCFAVSLAAVSFLQARSWKSIAGLVLLLLALGAGTVFCVDAQRVWLWQHAAGAISEYPLGYVASTKSLLVSAALPKHITHFHNDFLQTGVTLGVVGIFALLWFTFTYMREIYIKRSKQKEDFEKSSLAAGFGMCVGLIAMYFLESPLELSKNMMCIFFFMGIVLNAALDESRLRDMGRIAKTYL